MTGHWANEAVFYHVYPLGACGAPSHNDLISSPEPRLSKLFEHLDRWQRMGVTALYLGPVFESSAHGYDTADYFRVDRRLGDNALLVELVRELHRRSIRVILDGVFNHVGRDFWAFREVLRDGEGSPRCDWFKGIRFDAQSPYGDPFTYHGWQGCMDLIRLNLRNPEVREHLLAAVAQWIEELDIDGLRLDVADELERGFVGELGSFCRARRADFWLVGEMIHGDYRRLVNPEMLDSVTNYECYKGMWSSFNDHNFYEIAYALQRQFGGEGIYRDLPLYTFVDNHDVTRAASILSEQRHLYPLYLLLFSMPGVPSVYYGSEWGFPGRKEDGDGALRPVLSEANAQSSQALELEATVAALARLRHNSPALRRGTYRQLLVQSEQLVFARESGEETIVVALNSGSTDAVVEIPWEGGQLLDLLDDGPDQVAEIGDGHGRVAVRACSGRVLREVRGKGTCASVPAASS